MTLSPFPFTSEGFVLHLGRGSLAAVVKGSDREHEMYQWAVDHHEPHYGGVAGAAAQYARLVERFRGEVGSSVETGLVRVLVDSRSDATSG